MFRTLRTLRCNRPSYFVSRRTFRGAKNDEPPHQRSKPFLARSPLALGTAVAVGSAALLYESNEDARYVIKAIHRCGRAILTGAIMGADYGWTMATSSQDNLEEAKRQWNLRSARRVLQTLQSLGGIYIKWGQHLSSMVFILPDEWTSTLAALQDRCEAVTSPEAIRQLFLNDLDQPPDDLFDEFEYTPIGVASLAQVHRARLRSTGEWVAVKIQHPHLDEFCRIDIGTVSWIFGTIQRINPDFGFYWVAEDMRESIPQELDFRAEAANAENVKKLFNAPAAQHGRRPTALVIPNVLWAERRILCMEFMEGARVDDTDFMRKHNIDPMAVSSELISIFSEMMFLHGFVHCDPHPGNVMIRPNHETGTSINFDIILLDHGVYRALPDSLRVNYAHLWTSLIEGDEAGIQKYCARVGGTDYRLFASMLTGREWHTISNAQLTSARSEDEVDRVAHKDSSRFLKRIASILSTLPRVMLLLLKTGDLLRNVEEALRKGAATPSQPYTSIIIVGQYCTKAVWVEAKQQFYQRLRRVGLDWKMIKNLVIAWWKYERIECGLWIYRTLSSSRIISQYLL